MKNIGELTVKINVEFDGLYAELQAVKRQLAASERRAAHWKAIAESRLRMNTAAPDAFSVAEVYRWFDVPPSEVDETPADPVLVQRVNQQLGEWK